ncbi:hypothetical protein HDU86_005374 [Geranomyces michiganensis]|nr:hypothetical protein HDU86_005374 [Geranomyces michiganensis]
MSTTRSRYAAAAAACMLLLTITSSTTAVVTTVPTTTKNQPQVEKIYIPTLSNIRCTPSKIPLGSSAVNISWDLQEPTTTAHNRSRGVVSWQLYAQNAVVNITQDASGGGIDGGGGVVTNLVPLNGPASTSELSSAGGGGGFVVSDELDYYQFGELGLVDWTNQRLCLQTSIPYGNVDDNTASDEDPVGYSEQVFCPLDCRVVRPVKPFTVFKNLKFSPQLADVGDHVEIKWNYRKGFNFPKTVTLSLSFSSDYFEAAPEFTITTHAPAARKSYTLTITPLIAQFINKNAKLVNGRFTYRVYVMLTWAPQTDPLGALVAPGEFMLASSSAPSSESSSLLAKQPASATVGVAAMASLSSSSSSSLAADA